MISIRDMLAFLFKFFSEQTKIKYKTTIRKLKYVNTYDTNKYNF